jgi:hypothetical protein
VDELLTLARRGVPSTQVLDLNEVIGEALSSAQFNKRNGIHADVRIVSLISDKPHHFDLDYPNMLY